MERLGDAAAASFVAYVRELIADHSSNPRDDLLSRLLDVQREADDLTDDDIAATTILLFQAGHETVANMIAKGTLALIHHPEELAKLRSNPELITNGTEELLRYDTSVQLTTKFAAEEIPFHDRVIRAGDPVSLVWGAINRDPARYPEPDRLDLSRPDIDHYSFGMGSHYCLGASLARLETQHAIGTLVRRLPGLHLATEVLDFKPQLHLHGLATLPVAW
jgi:cytochrome P450